MALAALACAGLAACATAPSSGPAASWPPPADGLSATPPARGYVLVDRGTMVMRGGALERRESFDTWRGPAGERWQRSVVVAADDSYRVEGEWRSDAGGARHAVTGRGAIAGEPLAVAIDAQPGSARIEIRRGARAPETLEGRCAPECFVDLAPSAVAMFAMTRDPRVKRGEVREFRWIGHALQADAVLLDGVARFVRLDEQEFVRADGSRLRIRHDAFEETVTDHRSGRGGKVYFNLWTDAEGRPLKFTSSRVVGLRAGYEELASLAPVPIDRAFPGQGPAAVPAVPDSPTAPAR